MTSATDLHALNENELLQRVDEARRELFGLRFRHATGELENTAALQNAKRELARALTIARQRDIDVPETTKANG
ncbi:MAG: large subunit ribosomal protein [Solirubrobacteraceae bacterium]|nr:large subunit ribosomal protein [Solirubrobacteraceae bacterium]